MLSYVRLLIVGIALFLSLMIGAQAFAAHSASADPPGGVYNSAQSVTLTATQNSTIFFTTDGSDPTNSSSIYQSPIDISTNTTLKFYAVAEDNHTSSIITESYEIDMTSPQVLSTDPEDSETGVTTNATINATFSEPMDESTINTSTFLLKDRDNFPYTGTVTYDSGTNTATFVPDLLADSVFYTVTLKQDIKDISGNALQADYSWKFVTGPHMTIVLTEIKPSESNLLGGGVFTVTPNPFTLAGSLTVEDNEPSLDQDPTDGLISLRDIELGTFAISQSGVPAGFGNIYDNVIVTAHETSLSINLVAVFNNRNLTIPITDFQTPEGISVPPPDLTSDQFDLYQDSVVVGRYPGIQANGAENAVPITNVGPNSLESARLETVTTFESPEVIPRAMLFSIPGVTGSTAADLFSDFKIPTYPNIDSTIASDVFYVVPAFVIPYGDTGNNYLLTPVIENVASGLTLVLEQPAYIVSEEAKVERVNMTINTEGNNVGFSFAITDERPPGTPEPTLDAEALFLEIDFVGDVDFSNPASFESRPVIDILVNKTLSGFDQLPDGCVDFQLLLFDEGTEDWDVLEELRNPTQDTETQCGFTLQPEHFSKFAVGGVKGQTISTESDTDRNRGGGGGSRSTAVTPTAAGNDIETSVNTQSGEVLVRFESVQDGGGQLKINSNELSAFEEFFDEVAFLSQDNDEHGMVRINGVDYATTGNVFDIDALSVKFEGAVYVTIPYDEGTVTAFGAESDVRFLHYNIDLGIWEDKTAGVDEDANTVTGELDSLSPVTSAINLGGNLQVRNDNPEDNMMLRVMPTRPSFSLADAGTVTLTIDLSNERSVEQEYVLLVQFVDQNNVAQYIDWRHGSLAGTSNLAVSISWDDIEKGQYRAQVLVLTDLDSPFLLSEPVYSDLSI